MIKILLIIAPLIASNAALYAADRQPTPDHMKPHIMVVSVSSDGNYAITTDLYKHAVLWNLKAHTYKIVAKNANVYSAYFIKHTDDYMYQNDANNEVIIKSVGGKLVKQFNPGFPTYGQVITSDLKNYFASNEKFSIYKIVLPKGIKKEIGGYYCPKGLFRKGKDFKSWQIFGCMDFIGAGKLLNLSLSSSDKLLVGSDYGYVRIWSTYSGKELHRFKPDGAQTFATISPDGQYVVSGDAGGGNIYVFKVASGKYLKALEEFDYLVVSLKFITPNMLMAFFYGGPPTATLYSFPAGKKINSLSLLTLKQQQQVKELNYYQAADNYPENQSYVRDQAIDTSPSAHVLVMAMSQKNGILVYHYDPATQTLKQVWAPVVQQKAWWHVW